MQLRTNKIASGGYRYASKIFLLIFGPRLFKGANEILFWWYKKIIEGKLSNDHFKEFYTTFFKLSYEDYKDKKVLDIGCGPRGSLEWANNASERIGIDPLADKYVKMEGKYHKMNYINSGAENMPFRDEYFDFVSSLNSLDHVDDLDLCIKEIKRVVKKGGVFLLISDIHSFPTVAEPSNFGWDIAKRFEPEFSIEIENHFEGSNMYKSLRENSVFDHSDSKDRYGIIALKLLKN
jgi:ubiquinone/menaquinone biosynthesis C-methylase UbiE